MEAQPSEPQSVENRHDSLEVRLLAEQEEAEALTAETEGAIESILDVLDSLPTDQQAAKQQEVFQLTEQLKDFKKRLAKAEDDLDVLYLMNANRIKVVDRGIEKAQIKNEQAEETELKEERAELFEKMRTLAGETPSEKDRAAAIYQKIADSQRPKPAAVIKRVSGPDNQTTELYENDVDDAEEKSLLDKMMKHGLERDAAGDNKALADQAESKRLALKKQLTELWAKKDEDEAEAETPNLKKAA